MIRHGANADVNTHKIRVYECEYANTVASIHECIHEYFKSDNSGSMHQLHVYVISKLFYCVIIVTIIHVLQ